MFHAATEKVLQPPDKGGAEDVDIGSAVVIYPGVE
jgi:hypothetical protein